VFFEGYVGTPTSHSASPSSVTAHPAAISPHYSSLSLPPSLTLASICSMLLTRHRFHHSGHPPKYCLTAPAKWPFPCPQPHSTNHAYQLCQLTNKVAETQYKGRPLKSHRSIRCSYLKEYTSFDYQKGVISLQLIKE
jgi:hypothetical protein